MAAFNAYMKKYPQYKVVAIEDANWDQATSAKDTQQLLSKYASQGGIQAAYGMADNMAVGIIQGAKQAGAPIGVAKKGLIITGSNCLAVGINAIKAGQEYGTGTQAPQDEAALAVEDGGRDPRAARPRRPRCSTSRSSASRRRTWRSSRRSAPSSSATLDAMSEERDPAARSTGSRSASGGSRPRDGPPGRRRPLQVVRLGPGGAGPTRSTSGSARCTRSAGTTAPARARSSRRSSGSSGPTPGRSASTGRSSSLRNPHEAQAHGIALVNQELSLVPELSVEDNIFLGGLDVPLLYRRRRL